MWSLESKLRKDSGSWPFSIKFRYEFWSRYVAKKLLTVVRVKRTVVVYYLISKYFDHRVNIPKFLTVPWMSPGGLSRSKFNTKLKILTSRNALTSPSIFAPPLVLIWGKDMAGPIVRFTQLASLDTF